MAYDSFRLTEFQARRAVIKDEAHRRSLRRASRDQRERAIRIMREVGA